MKKIIPVLVCTALLLFSCASSKSEPKVNWPDDLNDALFEAIRQEDNEAVKKFLDAGADPNAVISPGISALQMAYVKQNTVIGQTLIDAGADVNYMCKMTYCQNPLIVVAALNNKIDFVRLLAENGADVNSMGSRKATALIASSCQGHTDVVTFLLEKGADAAIKGGYFNQTALDRAKANNHSDVISLLTKAAE